MKDVNFPLFKTKVQGVAKKFDLNDLAGRAEYFEAKAGEELKKIRAYLNDPASKEFVAFLIAKKASGKGTYSKLFMETVKSDRVGHLSVGDIVRDVHTSLTDENKKKDLLSFLKDNYRGFHSVEETIDLIEGRSQEKLMSSELILALVKYEISRRPKQAVFVDGFPRALDQIGYSLFLKELIGYQGHPDLFVFIDVPEMVIDERIKYRVICPKCQTPRNTRLLATKEVGYDEAEQKFYLKCDNPECGSARMIAKQGDELGIEPIRARLEADDVVAKKLMGLHGLPKVYLRNSVPVAEASEYVDDYEITPGYRYERGADGTIKTIEEPWVVKDENGVDCYSLMPAAVELSFIKQLVTALGL